MELTNNQTNKILDKLGNYKIGVYDMEDVPEGLIFLDGVQEEYFNEKVNEALEETQDINIKDVQRIIDHLWVYEFNNYKELGEPEEHIFKTLEKLQKSIAKEIAKKV